LRTSDDGCERDRNMLVISNKKENTFHQSALALYRRSADCLI